MEGKQSPCRTFCQRLLLFSPVSGFTWPRSLDDAAGHLPSAQFTDDRSNSADLSMQLVVVAKIDGITIDSP